MSQHASYGFNIILSQDLMIQEKEIALGIISLSSQEGTVSTGHKWKLLFYRSISPQYQECRQGAGAQM